ncbi:VanZ family protein [uncultured Allofournierella sp.]|uniref:VanZ family protein n=1 Tax=uncultured Allofournierella sp. TaxID=1940258 RepID=UPI003751187D
MDLVTIFNQLLRWGGFALIGGSAFLLLAAAGYFIYKKVLHGKKVLTKPQAVSVVLLGCWMFLVVGLTSLSRGANFTGSLNLDFLSGYINAWNNWSISELQLILFNMLMFAPLGFLLPLLWKKAEKFWVTLAISLTLTACLESVQFLTGTGIFELDDLFHNLLGSLFGYFCIMAILTTIREKALRFAPMARVLLIPGVIGLGLGAVFCVYNHQPYGNMDILPAVKQDLSAVEIVTQCQLGEHNARAAVYRNKYAEDKNYIQTVKTGLAQLEHLTFSKVTRRQDENLGYTGTNSNGTEFQILFFFRTGEWHYTTFAQTAAQLKEEEARRLGNRYETWMKEQNLLPENAEFSVQNGNTLRWDVIPNGDVLAGTEAFQQGSVMIQFDETGALSDFSYFVNWNEYVATEEIISERQAYEQVQAGDFEQYIPFQPGDTLYIKQCQLAYLYDTKGFYQPVYEFNGYINSSENSWVAQIPALSH